MGSDATSTNTTETNNLALDAASTNGEGLQILDSIVVDTSDQVMFETIQGHTAAFEALMGQGTIQLTELLGIGKQILSLVDSTQIQMMGAGYHQLETGVRMLEQQMAQGKYVIDLVDTLAGKTFDLANTVSEGNDERLEQALGIVADVKTDGVLDLSKVVVAMMTLFGLGAILLLKD